MISIRFESFWRLAMIGMVMLMTAAPPIAATEPTEDWQPAPFRATFAVQYRWLGNVGTAAIELNRTGSDTWRYTSRNIASGVARLKFPDAITQSSDFVFSAGVTRPLRYRADDGSKSTTRDVSLDFDQATQRASGISENVDVDLALVPNLQDTMSVQIAQMYAAASGDVPVTFWTIDKGIIKGYEFTLVGPERASTALGEIDTIVFESARAGSSRKLRLWMAPSLGYLSVRVERRKGDTVEFSMTIREFERI